jgi:hypothetical protein
MDSATRKHHLFVIATESRHGLRDEEAITFPTDASRENPW